MELVFRMTALCVICAVLGLVLKKGSPEFALLLTLTAAVLVLLSLCEPFRQAVGLIEQLAETNGALPVLLSPLYKTAGIAVVVKTGSCLCKDAGESALAAVIETTGTICAFLVTLPLVRIVLDVLLELIK